ncbi:MAG TPA: Ig-like domain-containing protein, partial [Candidatus Thermoplasmatota archaeon]|nr:Ig-like domain-containing protein [Candidatus Thermoplasmatota archaeon]
MVVLGRAVACLLLLMLLPLPAVAWTGTVTGGGTTYDARDNPAVTGAYSLVYGSGNWVASPSGSWANIDISPTGTVATIPDSYGGGNNKWSAAIPIGFSFQYFGTSYTNVHAHGYGALGFSTAQSFSNFVYPMTSANTPNNIIAGIIDTDVNAGCAQAKGFVGYKTEGAPGDRVFIFQFTDLLIRNGGACAQQCAAQANCGLTTYQVRLYEGTNAIEVHYKRSDNRYNNAVWGTERYAGLRGPGIGLPFTPVENSGTTHVVVTDRVVQYRPTTAFPTAVADTYTLDKKRDGNAIIVDGLAHGAQPAASKLLANDKSVGSASLRAVLVGSVSGGTLETVVGGACSGTAGINPDGSFCFKLPSVQPCGPPGSLYKDYTFLYHADDAWADDASATPKDRATVTIRATNCNEPPTATADKYTAFEDLVLAVPAADGVLANDGDIDNGPQPLQAQLVAPPSRTGAGGSFTLNADGSFTYRADPDYNGPDSFTYRAFDGTDSSAVVKVDIDVKPVNDPPVATPASYQATEDQDAVIVLTGTDIDAPGDPDAIKSCRVTQPPAKGTLSPATGTSCVRVYRGNLDFSGEDSFLFRVGDGQTESVDAAKARVFVLPYNDHPDAKPVELTVPEDGWGVGHGDATDRDEGTLASCEVVQQPLRGTAHADPALGVCALVYTPEPDYWGLDAFTYRAFDDQGVGTPGATATVSVTVVDQPDAPWVTPVDATLLEDSTYGPGSPGYAAFANDKDVEQPTCIVIVQPSMGRVEGTRCDDLRYIPDPNRAGTDSFVYRVVDPVLGQQPGDHVATFTILDVNDLPLVEPVSVTTQEDRSILIPLPARDVETGPEGLTCQTTSPQHGELRTVAPCLVRYTPVPDFHGEDMFLYRAHDGLQPSADALVSILVVPEDDAAETHDAAYETDEDVPVLVQMPIYDVDGAGTCAVTQSPSHGTLRGSGCNVWYHPAPDFHGADRFRFRASVGGRESTVFILVRAVPDPPAADNDIYRVHPGRLLTIDASAGVLGNDRHPDGRAMRAELAIPPKAGRVTLHPDGSFWYDTSLAHGEDAFVYVVRDDLNQSTFATVTLRVVGNEPPQARIVARALSLPAGAPFKAEDRSTDGDGDMLTRVWDLGDGTASTERELEHRYKQPGIYVVRLLVRDPHGAESVATVLVTVQAPDAKPSGALAADAGPDLRAAPGERVEVRGAELPSPTVRYLWRQVAGPKVDLEGADRATVAFTMPTLHGLDAVVLELIVFDGAAASEPDRVEILAASSPPPGTPVVSAGGALVAKPGERVQVKPETRNFAGDVAFTWRQVEGPAVDIDVGVDGRAVGSLEVHLRAGDLAPQVAHGGRRQLRAPHLDALARGGASR